MAAGARRLPPDALIKAGSMHPDPEHPGTADPSAASDPATADVPPPGSASDIRAIRIREPGGPEVLELVRITLPPLLPHEVRVRVHASGLNRADLLERRGGHQPQPGAPPRIPGLEYAGTVEAVGSACTLRSVGDRVMGILGGGAYAEVVQVAERETIRVPAGVGLEEAAALPEAWLTAWDAAFLQGGLGAGETLLVHAVGSGVGTAALQLARWAGARVVGTSRTLEKLEDARHLGLEHGVLTGEEGAALGPWPERVRAATGGAGVDVVLDLVGGGYAGGTLQALAPHARWIVVGIPSGREAALDLRTLMGLRASIRGTMLRSRPPEEKATLARAFERQVVPGFEPHPDGRPRALRGVVDRVLPAESVVEAHRLMEANRNFGKLLLAW
jgi:NADPH2:quinone reductase